MRLPQITIKKVCQSILMAYFFLVPLFFYNGFAHSIVQGKELLLKTSVLILFGLVALYFIKGIKLIDKRIFENRIFLVILAGFGVSLLAAACSPTPLVALFGSFSRGFGVIIETYILVLLIVSASIVDKKNIQKFLIAIWTSGLLVAFYGLLQKIGFDPFFSYLNINIFAGRIFSSLGNPGYLGQFMLLTLFIGIYLAKFNNKSSIRAAYIVGSSVMLIVMLLSETRAALFALLIGIILISVRYGKNIFTKKRAKIFSIVSLSFILILIGANRYIGDRFSFSDNSFRSVYSRFEIWKGAIQKIEERPLLGYGSETFYIYSPEVVTKKFLTLEEDVGITADRVHNELLDTVFSHGIGGGILYLVLIAMLTLTVLFNKEDQIAILAFIPLINSVQNQLTFSDITITSISTLCLAGVIALSIKKTPIKKLDNKTIALPLRIAIFSITIIFLILVGFETIYKPFTAHKSYNNYIKTSSIDYETSINSLKKTLEITPYYSEPWYELMIVDPSSQARALTYLSALEADSGNVMAWSGNFYTNIDLVKASEFYTRALEKNPYNPNWIRAFADMLYKQGDHETALLLYEQYLQAVPDFYTWKDRLNEHSQKERQSYEVYMKHSPFFWLTYSRIEELRKEFGDSEQK